MLYIQHAQYQVHGSRAEDNVLQHTCYCKLPKRHSFSIL